jgi:hypothetical protein
VRRGDRASGGTDQRSLDDTTRDEEVMATQRANRDPAPVAAPSGLEFCIRDQHGNLVAPCRPVEDLAHTIDAANERAYWVGFQVGRYPETPDTYRRRLQPLEHRIRQWLGLEPA